LTLNIAPFLDSFTDTRLILTHLLKSSLYTTQFPMKCADILLDLPPREMEAIDRFAEPLGVLYQLIDDYSDYFPNSTKFNAKPSRDYRQGKLTVPLYAGLLNSGIFQVAHTLISLSSSRMDVTYFSSLDRKYKAGAWTHIRPTHFMRNYLLDAPTIAAQNAFYYPMGDKLVAPIDAHDIAKVFYEALTTKGHADKVYELSGPEALTMHDIASRLSKTLGRTIQYVDVSPEEYRKQMIGFGVPGMLADAINELYDEHRKGTESKVLLETHRLFDVKPTTFAEFIGQNIKALDTPKMH
jgi:hypothetical protein